MNRRSRRRRSPRSAGRPAASRRVQVVPVRHTGVDHHMLARILLAILTHQDTDETSAGDTPRKTGTAKTTPAATAARPGGIQ